MRIGFQKITIIEKGLIERFLKKYPNEASEYTFCNFFLFQSSDPEYAIYKEHLIIRFTLKNKFSFLEPIGQNPVPIIIELLQNFNGCAIDAVSENVASELKEVAATIAETRHNWDYVYLKKEIVGLKGARFEAKRNLIHRFAGYSPRTEIISKKNITHCMDFLEVWCKSKECASNKYLKEEAKGNMLALENFVELGMFGICVYIDEKVVGFAIGESKKEMFYEHFEKADSSYTGCYQFILHELAKNMPAEIVYINREQDLGIKGLRQAKESWHPEYMVKKYKISSPQIHFLHTTAIFI